LSQIVHNLRRPRVLPGTSPHRFPTETREQDQNKREQASMKIVDFPCDSSSAYFSGRGGRRFKSCHSDQSSSNVIKLSQASGRGFVGYRDSYRDRNYFAHSSRSPRASGLANGRAGLLRSPALGERRQRSLACRLVAVHRALYRSIVAARPHPRSPPWPDWHQENAAHHNAVLKHVVVLLVPADRRAFEDQTEPSLEAQCFWVAPRTAVTLGAKKTVPKRLRPPAKAKHAQTSNRTASKRRPRVLASISQTTPMEGDLGAS
jgi:hypothetical protein